MSQNSYLHHFTTQVSQIDFLRYLTVLRLITTAWPEMSENSYICDFNSQLSQIVFLTYLNVLRLITHYNWNCQKTDISTISVHKYHKSCS